MTENILNQEATEDRETFSSGAVRDKVDYRYDLMSPHIVSWYLNDDYLLQLAETLLYYAHPRSLKDNLQDAILDKLNEFCGAGKWNVPHLYAQALHEGASKYGERNYEAGIPESNLVNHALFHLFKLNEGDTSENHLSHLVWNVMTIIHFREQDNEKKGEAQ
jgi:hypothetical protein